MKLLRTASTGFTLIEIIVSLGVFSIVLTITTGALLSVISSNQRSQNEQNVMTNLSFALDGMTRELRTGFNYYCVSSNGNFNTYNQEGVSTAVQDCPGGRGGNKYHGVSFYEGGNSISGAANRIMFFYGFDEKKIYRKIGNASPESIVSDSVDIVAADFFVTNAGKLTASGDTRQPNVTITVQAQARDAVGAAVKVYYIQSSVTQREIDL